MGRILLLFLGIVLATASYVPLQSGCNGRCCPATGSCQAASCSGNGLGNGHETECVVSAAKFNQGGQCPWSGQTYGLYCSYLPGCTVGKNNNCYGSTLCGKGSCPPASLGLLCIESGSSNSFKLCDVTDADCVVGEWDDWAPCVNGQQSASRVVVTQPSGKGAACPSLAKTRSCVPDVDCKVSDWGPWGPCVNGQQSTTRSITTQQSGNGAACPTLSDVQPCVPDVDCQVSPWGEWGPCLDNIQSKTRYIVTPPSGAGAGCPPLAEAQSCGDLCDGVVKSKADFYVTAFNKPVSGNVMTNDANVKRVEIVSGTQSGALSFNDGVFSYQPSQDYCGTESFVYRAYVDDCFADQDAVITTTCGCGTGVSTVSCSLDLTQSVTNCVLPGGGTVPVPNKPGYKVAIIKLNAKVSYKKK